jgi:zeaxanthin glucosyltransferase
MKIGFVSMPKSHLNGMTTLARKLKSRGHDVIIIGFLDAESVVRAAGLTFVPFCEQEYPLLSIDRKFSMLAKLDGLEAVRYGAQEISPGIVQAAYDHLPEKLAQLQIDALVIDASYPFLELVPMSLGIPFVQVWLALHIDATGTTPFCFFSWPHETTPHAVARNIKGLKTIADMYPPIIAVAQAYAEKVGLSIDWRDIRSIVSKLAIITQIPKEFDFPGIPWPSQFHYTGPLHDGTGRESIPFPWNQLTGKPLIYVSLGTLLHDKAYMAKVILDAMASLVGVQVVFSVGLESCHLGAIPENTIVVSKAPQVELLKLSCLCVTHGGANTVLEALAQGVPLVALPIAFDQPGMAARIAYHGVGEFLELQDLTASRLSALIQQVLTTPRYRERARYFQTVIEQTRGLDMAADIIERAFQIDSPGKNSTHGAQLLEMNLGINAR